MTNLSPDDRRWLDAAARYAAHYSGTTADNPAVGALVVNPLTQTLVARAVTAKGGRPHAEAEAIARAGFEAAGCTLYVTLEPCNHWGRTPPCVDAIIRAGIMRVVIGVTDTDPRSAGGSVARLESAGVEVTLADHAPSRSVHAGHLLRHTANRPFVTAAVFLSADGTLAPRIAGRAPLEGSAGDWLQMLRARSDAVLIGAATAQADDPTLAVTLPALTGRTPLRVVLVGAHGIDRKLNLIGGFSGYRTAVLAESTAAVDVPVSVEVIRAAGTNGRPDLTAALQMLAEKRIQNLLIEPGRRLLRALLAADIVDRFALIEQAKRQEESRDSSSSDASIPNDLAAAGYTVAGCQPLVDSTVTLYERPLRGE